MAVRSKAQLKQLLDELYHRYSRPVFLSTSALSIPHQYVRPEDQEIAAFVAASLAYGNVKQIHRSANAALEAMGKSPARFIRRFDPARDSARFQYFVHRFNSGVDLALLCHLLRQAIAAEGSLQAFFLDGYDPAHEDIESALASFVERILSLDVSAFYPSGILPARAGVRFFFPSPAQGSACKRLNLFLRWMVRRGDEIDFGIWTEVSPAKLIVPLDTHVARIARQLGLTRIKQPNWRMAKEVTRRLRAFDPEDPVKYD
ncbi:MAG: TIGR02757 family protein, partial [bacterium]|nr:TIGR02757 family protein [Candidatus Methylomirabilis sp.]